MSDPLVTLDLKTLLPLTRAAYDAKQLQAQQPKDRSGLNCSYAGGCAIGVGIPVDLRDVLDDDPQDSDIASLLNRGIVAAPAHQHIALTELQVTHDNWVSCPSLEYRFLAVLERLEVQYHA